MALTEHDVDRLRRALALARKGFFAVEPNPPVGCVIEREGEGIVGESWHGAFGGPHAEVGALLIAAEAARGATAYVSLAPCGREGKTPPCADALVEAGVARVVFVSADPNPEENACGIERLRAAGVVVDGPVDALRSEGDALLRRFRDALSRKRPWTMLKWAMSLDGRIAPVRGSGGALSGRRAALLTHGWRGHADAVAVGIGTVLADDPRLTCRLEGGVPDGRGQPLRVVFDAALRTPPAGRLVSAAHRLPLLIFSGEDADAGRRATLEAAGVRVEGLPASEGKLDLALALEVLHEVGVRRLLVEGGARLHGSFLRGSLADQVAVFVAPLLLGGTDAVPAVEGAGFEDLALAPRLEDVVWRRLGDDLLLQGYVPRGLDSGPSSGRAKSRAQ